MWFYEDDLPYLGGRTNNKIYTLQNVEIDAYAYGGYYLKDTSNDINHHLDGMRLFFDEANIDSLGRDKSDTYPDLVINKITFLGERIHYNNYRIIVPNMGIN